MSHRVPPPATRQRYGSQKQENAILPTTIPTSRPKCCAISWRSLNHAARKSSRSGKISSVPLIIFAEARGCCNANPLYSIFPLYSSASCGIIQLYLIFAAGRCRAGLSTGKPTTVCKIASEMYPFGCRSGAFLILSVMEIHLHRKDE